MKVLGVDYGEKRVGLASGDDLSKIAFPKGVIFRKTDEQVVEDLSKICEEEGYKKVVFGIPVNIEGGNRQEEVIKAFIGKFKKVSSIEVDTIDEGFSSFEADAYLADFSGKKMRMAEGDRDAMAAKVILERYFSEN